mgnify:CR=1 FL=1
MGVNRTVLALLGLVSLTTVSCIPGTIRDTEVSPQTITTVDNANILTDPQGRVQLELLSGWEEAPEKTLHDSADLYAKQEDKELYLVVVGEASSAIATDDLREVAQNYRQLITEALDQVETVEAQNVGQISGYSAIQYEIRGTLDNKSIVYLHTTVSVDDMYYQVVAWTSADGYLRHREELQQIINSFSPV